MLHAKGSLSKKSLKEWQGCSVLGWDQTTVDALQANDCIGWYGVCVSLKITALDIDRMCSSCLREGINPTMLRHATSLLVPCHSEKSLSKPLHVSSFIWVPYTPVTLLSFVPPYGLYTIAHLITNEQSDQTNQSKPDRQRKPWLDKVSFNKWAGSAFVYHFYL